MAKLYEQLQKALTSYADRPLGMINEPKFSDSAFIIRGKDRGMDAWHCILVPADKLADLKAQRTGGTLDVTNFGRVIQYRDRRGQIMPMSGWGTDPPKALEAWMDEHYGSTSIDEKINLIYEEDDIRLCTMQRAIPKQLLGVQFYSHRRQERFHYIKLLEDLEMSLARQAGIKRFDRIITLNGVNVENHTYDHFYARFDSERHLPVQMLVCSPATYAHYKQNDKLLHINLPTVQRLKPVYATSTSNSHTDTPAVLVDPQSFCAVEWENTNAVSTVPQSAVFKSPEFTRVNDTCFVEVEEEYRRGKILCIGSFSDCEKLAKVSTTEAHGEISLLISSSTTISNFNVANVKHASSRNSLGVPATFEQLPNELFYHLFIYLDIHHIYKAFSPLNARFHALFQSCQNLSLTFDDKTDQLSMKSCAPYVLRLIIDTSIHCDLNQFPNLQALIVCDASSKHLTQIRPNILPNLVHLSLLLGSTFTPSSSLVDNVFSNKFPSLGHVNLGRLNDVNDSTWSTSPSLRFVSFRCNEPLIVSCVLASCPNLDHLQVHVCDKIRDEALSSPPPNHPLQRFTLWSDSVELSAAHIETILVNTPNVQRLYLQTVFVKPFIDLVDGLIHQLNRLSRFDCHVKEMMSKEKRSGNLATVHKTHPAFNRIECIKENDDFRIFATK